MSVDDLRRAADALAEMDLPDARACELARRLVAPGPKAHAVSASETHEVTRAVLAAYDIDSPIVVFAQYAVALARLFEACEAWEVAARTTCRCPGNLDCHVPECEVGRADVALSHAVARVRTAGRGP
jgi:hypothetical protein